MRPVFPFQPAFPAPVRKRRCPSAPALLTMLLLATAIAFCLVMPGSPVPAYAHDAAPSLPPAPTGVTAADGAEPGAAIVRWRAVPAAAYYRIGWVAMSDVAAARADGREWLDAFVYTAVANRGQTAHAVAGLKPGAEYAFIVATIAARFGAGNWSEWAYLTLAAPAGASAADTERAALAALYHAANGDSWAENANWLSDKPLGQWHGVTTNDAGKVTSLSLNYNLLTGRIPAELGALSSLQSLNLGGNRLTGNIPAELGRLSGLQTLILTWNQLTGGIPAELGSLNDLQSLGLNYNNLTGGIPPELGGLANLELLNISYNQLTGAIPAELGSLVNLEQLYLNDNGLTGEIPAELGSLANLTSLDLDNNELTGGIPAELGNLSNLLLLYLRRNQLTGEIPVELGNLANLQELHLNSNRLTGRIPAELGSIDSLQKLYLIRNQFTGCLPAAWRASIGRDTTDIDFLGLPFCDTPSDAPLPSSNDRAALVALYNAADGPNWRYADNWASDSPIWTWQGVDITLNGRVTQLHLPRNRLTGPIPAELGSLARLWRLYLSDNRLTGEIPPELGNLANLQSLELGANQLTGEIPAELGNLHNLEQLDLGHNRLTGAIPAELGSLPNLRYLYLDGNRLTGCIPPALADIPTNDLAKLDLPFCDP